MPRDSNWNTATVSPRANSLVASARRRAATVVDVQRRPGLSAARRALMAFTAQSMMVSVRRPRKSNLTRPIASTSSLSNWVTGSRCRVGLRIPRRAGEIGQRARRDDHAAGVLAGVAGQVFEAAVPDRPVAHVVLVAIARAQFAGDAIGLLLRLVRRPSASSSVRSSGRAGISLAMPSTGRREDRARGRSRARTALAAMVP